MNAIAPSFGAHVNHWVADTRGSTVEDFVVPENTQRKNVHQGIAVVTLFEHALPAHRGNAKTVAIVRDARYHALQDALVASPGLRIVQPPEANRIQHRDRPRAHREDIAQNAAHARRRTLERLYEAGVVVRFNLE